jgi:hypothetical protein
VTTPGNPSGPSHPGQWHPLYDKEPDRRTEVAIFNGILYFRSGYDRMSTDADGNVFMETQRWERVSGHYDLNLKLRHGMRPTGRPSTPDMMDFELNASLQKIEPKEGQVYYGTNYSEHS